MSVLTMTGKAYEEKPANEPEPVQAVIDVLEMLLKDAKEGNILQIAVAIVKPAGSVATGVAGQNNLIMLLGASERMVRHVHLAIDDTMEIVHG